APFRGGAVPVRGAARRGARHRGGARRAAGGRQRGGGGGARRGGNGAGAGPRDRRRRLHARQQHPHRVGGPRAAAGTDRAGAGGAGERTRMSTQSEPEFEALLAHVKQSRGSDFTGYKRSTLARRFRKRMDEVVMDTYTAYSAYLDAHPDEFTALFNTILINVTSFFRDPEAWEALSREVLAPLTARKAPHEAFRVWSAG